MGCTSAKQVSAVPNGEEGQNKSYSNGDLLSGQCSYCALVCMPGMVKLLDDRKDKRFELLIKSCLEFQLTI